MSIYATFMVDHVITEDTDQARELFARSQFGTISNKKVRLTPIEALYLVDQEKIEVHNRRNQYITFEQLVKKIQKTEKQIWTKYTVYKDLRKRGYIVKTGLKFGADFRVYDKGTKPGQDHAKWIVHPVTESAPLNWYEFSGKNRVAHSTKKRLLLGIVDDESKVTYFEVQWVKP